MGRKNTLFRMAAYEAGTQEERGLMSVAGLQVRVGIAADLEAVVALERAVGEAPHWGEPEYAAIVSSQEDTRGGVQGGGVRRCLLVAEAEGRLVGFAVGKVIGAWPDCLAELESVVVEARTRRGGVGRALCGAVVEWCRRQGAAAIELEVRAGSAGAIALYAGLGFVVVGGRGAYYHEPVDDALLMRLDLERTSNPHLPGLRALW
jgi:[ribosomal protein S18]-alanine N-acetyltransferase